MTEITLVPVLEEMQLAPEQKNTLLDNFGDLFVEAHKLIAKSKVIEVTSEDQVEEMKEAKRLRIQLMKVRTEAEKTKKLIKEPYLRGAKAAQDIYNSIRDLTKPEELRLSEQEKFAELAEIARVEKRHTERVQRLSRYVSDVSVYSLREMPDDVFERLMVDCKAAYDAKVEAKKREEEEEIKKREKVEIFRKRQIEMAAYEDFMKGFLLEVETTEERYQDELSMAIKAKSKYEKEQEEIRAENEKMRKEAEEKEKELEKERRIQAEKEAKLREEKEALERKIREEKEESERKTKEAQEKKEREVREEEEKKRKALLAPDKEKLLLFASSIDEIKSPALSSGEAQDIYREAVKLLEQASDLVREKSRKL